MTKLTQAQHSLLMLAADSDSGAAHAPEDARSTVAALIKRGFVISMPQAEGGSQVILTAAGRAAIGRPDQAAVAPQAAPPIVIQPKGKLGIVMDLLSQPGGATIEVLMSATGWQQHSVRGALAGAVRKKLGRAVTSEKVDCVRIYRITDEAAA